MPERLLLAECETAEQFEKRLREHLPDLADRLEALAPDRDPQAEVGHALATRRLAREFVAAHPEISGRVELDCSYVEVISPPFVHELLKLWPEAVFVEANEDVRETVAFVGERRDA